MNDKARIKKIVIAVASFVFVVIVIVAICLVLGAQSSKSGRHENIPADQKNQEISVILENNFHLFYPLSYQGLNFAKSQIDKVVTKESELAAASNKYDYIDSTTATIVDDGTFEMVSENPEVYSFKLHIDDGRDYNVWVIAQRDPQSEVVTFLSTAFKRANYDQALVYASSDNNDSLSMVKAWLANNEVVKNPEIEIVEPEEDSYDANDKEEEARSYDENGNRIAR